MPRPKTAAQTLCEPARSKCTSTLHKKHFTQKNAGNMPCPTWSTPIKHRLLHLPYEPVRVHTHCLGNESMSIEPHRCKIVVGPDRKLRLLLINSSNISYLSSNLHPYTFPKAVSVSHKLVERQFCQIISCKMEFFHLTSIIHVVPGVECQWYQQSAVRGLQILALLGDWRTLDPSTRRRDSWQPMATPNQR